MNTPGRVTAHQWREAAIVVRQHAMKFDDLAVEAERREAVVPTSAELVIDRLLAVLAIHRPSLVMQGGKYRGKQICVDCVGLDDDHEPIEVEWPCRTARACGVTE